MQRSKLRNLFLKKKTEENRNNYVKQRNLCVTLLQKSKREFFGSLNETHLCNNKKFLSLYYQIKLFIMRESLSQRMTRL